MPFDREEVHDALDRLIRIIRVQRSEAEVSGFSERDRGFHGFRIPDFTDENDVRCLTQGIFQRVSEGMGVEADFALSDDRFLVVMDKFDRVFHADDVARMHRVAVVDHRGEGRGFSRAGRADHQHQTPLGHSDVFDDRRQV